MAADRLLPLMNELAAGVSHLHESAPFSTAGNFTEAPRDDDIDWTILALALAEGYGPVLTTADIARGWLDRLPFTQTFTAERAAYRNLIYGLKPPQTASIDNPYREWIGALIRADMFGYLNPGNTARAAREAVVDARLSHLGNGIYGEMWAAALVAAALATESRKRRWSARLPSRRCAPASPRANARCSICAAPARLPTPRWSGSIARSVTIIGCTPSTMPR